MVRIWFGETEAVPKRRSPRELPWIRGSSGPAPTACRRQNSVLQSLIFTSHLGGFHSHGGTPIAEWFMKEHAIKIDDLGLPSLMESLISAYSRPFLSVSAYSFLRKPCAWRNWKKTTKRHQQHYETEQPHPEKVNRSPPRRWTSLDTLVTSATVTGMSGLHQTVSPGPWAPALGCEVGKLSWTQSRIWRCRLKRMGFYIMGPQI